MQESKAAQGSSSRGPREKAKRRGSTRRRQLQLLLDDDDRGHETMRELFMRTEQDSRSIIEKQAYLEYHDIANDFQAVLPGSGARGSRALSRESVCHSYGSNVDAFFYNGITAIASDQTPLGKYSSRTVESEDGPIEGGESDGENMRPVIADHDGTNDVSPSRFMAHSSRGNMFAMVENRYKCLANANRALLKNLEDLLASREELERQLDEELRDKSPEYKSQLLIKADEQLEEELRKFISSREKLEKQLKEGGVARL
ncbi:hypothetical protein ERJ75_001664300 [Trypanosoma vivax]|nr:hypothetical protein ERJ75_001664300 [Trypanosoma vivax]